MIGWISISKTKYFDSINSFKFVGFAQLTSQTSDFGSHGHNCHNKIWIVKFQLSSSSRLDKQSNGWIMTIHWHQFWFWTTKPLRVVIISIKLFRQVKKYFKIFVKPDLIESVFTVRNPLTIIDRFVDWLKKRFMLNLSLNVIIFNFVGL